MSLELPDDLVALWGSPQAAAAKAKEALVMELLREARIGQSRAAELLGISRGAVLDLTVQYGVPSGPSTADETDREVADMRSWLRNQEPHGGR